MSGRGGTALAIPPLSGRVLAAQIQHVNVGAQSHVVSQVPADVVGIFIDDDVIAIPEPAVDIADIVRRDAEIETAKPESVRTAAPEPPDMMRAERTGETPVFPWMIEVVVGVVPAGVMPHPLIVGRVNVRRLRMARPIVKLAVIRGGIRLSYVRGGVGCRRRTVSRDVSSANLGMAWTAVRLTLTTVRLTLTTVWLTTASRMTLGLATSLCEGKDT
jgi:hypothetical protein